MQLNNTQACTHQFSSLCAWNALKNDVTGQGEKLTDCQKLMRKKDDLSSLQCVCMFIMKDIGRRVSGTCRLQQSHDLPQRRYIYNTQSQTLCTCTDLTSLAQKPVLAADFLSLVTGKIHTNMEQVGSRELSGCSTYQTFKKLVITEKWDWG